MFTIEITDTIPKLESKANTAIVNYLNQKIPLALPKIQANLRGRFKPIFINTPTYHSLTSGSLMAHFGLPRGQAKNMVDAIVDVLDNSLHIEFTKLRKGGKNGITGGISVYAFVGDFMDIRSLQEAYVHTRKGQDLPWLNWLLIQGNKIIIHDYQIRFGSYPRSRSGSAIMFEKPGRVWRVPSGYAGTMGNNWITNAIDDSAKYLEAIVSLVIEKAIESVI